MITRRRSRRSLVVTALLLTTLGFGWRALAPSWLVGLRGSTDDGSTDISFEQGIAPEADTDAIDRRPYPEVSFASTHNSYSGGLSHVRASLVKQLDVGVRALELDVHAEDYATHGFRIGHLGPGDDVYEGPGNPTTLALEDWLGAIATWSDAHPRHAPITLLLDVKDDLSESPSFMEGDLFALNARIEAAFGRKLLRAEDVDSKSFPTVGELRGRVLVVLSGDEDTRLSYRGVRGDHAAIASNEGGAIVMTYDDGDGDLWYFTGVDPGDGSIDWLRQGRYDTGQNPAVAIDTAGLVVEVHEGSGFSSHALWYRVGRMTADHELAWARKGGLELPIDEGMNPTVERLDSRRVRVTFTRPDNARASITGRLDPESASIAWGAPTLAPGVWHEADVAVRGQRRISVFTGSDGGFGENILLYSTDPRGQPRRIRPAQLAFVEAQHGGRSELERDGLFFYSGSAEELSARVWAAGWRAAGKVARLWCFNDAALTSEASVNFPATDLPFARWYGGYKATLGCAR